LNASAQRHDLCTLRCVIVAPCMPLDDRNHRSVSHQHIYAGRVHGSLALNDQLQVAAVQKEKSGTMDGALGYTTHYGAG